MVRSTDYKDTRIISDLLVDFLQETAYDQAPDAAQNQEHIFKIIWTVHQYGKIWIAESEGVPAGLLMAVIEPNFWYPRIKEMRELVWYVRPEYRNGMIGGRLFKTYCDYAESLKQKGTIAGYWTTRMRTTQDQSLDRRGFRLKELTYLKD